MDKRLEQIRQFLKGIGKDSVIVDHLYSLSSDDERIEELNTAIDIYNNAPNLEPSDLKRLIKKFREFKEDGTEQPIKSRRRTGAKEPVKGFKNRGNWQDRVISNDGKMTDYELVELLKEIDKKAPKLDQLIGNPFEQNVKNTPKDWQERIEKLVFLEELYPVRGNISEIINRKYVDKESGYNQYREWLEETFKILKKRFLS